MQASVPESQVKMQRHVSRGSRHLSALGAAATFLMACSGVFQALVPLPLGDGAVDAAGPDGGRPVGPKDADAAEAADGRPGSRDAEPDSIVGPAPGTFCARTDATFCDDFDTTSAPRGWSSSGTQSATLAVVAGDAMSAPNKLVAGLQAGPGVHFATQNLDLVFPARTRIRVECDIRVSATFGHLNVVIGKVLPFEPGTTDHAFVFTFVPLEAESIRFEEFAVYADAATALRSLGRAGTWDSWRHVVIDVRRVAEGVESTGTIDDASVGALRAVRGTPATVFRLTVGAVTQDSTARSEAQYDNVVVTTLPD